jgi:hypothetical protein
MIAKIVHAAKQPIYPSVVTTRMRRRKQALGRIAVGLACEAGHNRGDLIHSRGTLNLP